VFIIKFIDTTHTHNEFFVSNPKNRSFTLRIEKQQSQRMWRVIKFHFCLS